ncbi:MAG: hypothetical protein HYU39_10460 [Thaumarchaeota archaeon]|nr:hypothetical protein [Nitrososphaerota archaeon]
MRLLLLTLIVVSGASGLMLHASGQEDYAPDRLLFTVYLDGNVQVDYAITPDPILPSVNVTLFGKIYDNLLIQNENRTVLDFRSGRGPVTVFTLGSRQAAISYSTQDLVNKSGRIWTFSVVSPINFSVTFPREATIISLSSLPRSIGIQGGQTSILMQSGRQEVGYITGTLGTREVSTLLINKARSVIEEVKSRSVAVGEAEAKLREAEVALRSQNFQDAERLATAAIDLAVKTDSDAKAAQESMRGGETLVKQAETEGRTSRLDEARQLLQGAATRFNEGRYVDALGLAQQASSVAQTSARSGLAMDLTLPIAAVAGGGAAAFLVYYFRRRMTISGTEVAHEKQVRKIDVSKILDVKPHLRAEDREVIQVLAEMGGEGFETELREKFKFPKTTMWRTVKRLQREDIAEVVKVGGQNMIRLKEPPPEEGE